jgi:hypothetical protein
VAIVAAQTDPLWCNADPDVLGYTATISTDEIATHRALTHGHHPVRFLVEERLPQDLGVDTKVLLLHRRHLSNAAFAAIEAWVRAGGTLVVIGQLPVCDELANPVAARLAFLGTDDQPLDEWTPPYTVNFVGGSPMTSPYPRRPVAVGAGTVLATYDDVDVDIGAAVVEMAGGPRGDGRVRIVGSVLSRVYIDFKEPCLNSSLPPELGRFPEYEPSVRDAVFRLVGDHVDRPAWADEPLVEVVRMAGNDGESLVLLNYTNADIGALTVNVPDWDGIAHALFADTDVTFEAGVASLALRDVEVLKLG